MILKFNNQLNTKIYIKESIIWSWESARIIIHLFITYKHYLIINCINGYIYIYLLTDKTPQKSAQYPKVLPNTSQPRVNPPKPTTYEPIELDLSPVRDTSNTETPERIETEMSQPLPSRLEASMNQAKDKDIKTVRCKH